MSAEYDEFGKQSVVDLVRKERDIPVTEENKGEYVRLVTGVRMTKTIEKQIEAFKRDSTSSSPTTTLRSLTSWS